MEKNVEADGRKHHKVINKIYVEVSCYGHKFDGDCKHCVKYLKHCEYNPDYEKNPKKKRINVRNKK